MAAEEENTRSECKRDCWWINGEEERAAVREEELQLIVLGWNPNAAILDVETLSLGFDHRTKMDAFFGVVDVLVEGDLA